MGTWSSSLYGNDTTEDVRDIYVEHLKKHDSNEEAYKKTCEECREYMEDEDEPLFWYALADTQWKYGRLMPEVKEKALWWIRHDGGMPMWAGDQTGARRWKKTLEKLRIKLNTEMPPEKQFIHSHPFVKNPWNVGEVYAYQFHTDLAKKLGCQDKYILLQKVGDVTERKDIQYSVICVYNVLFDEIPLIDKIKAIRKLPLIEPYEIDNELEEVEYYHPGFEWYFNAIMRYYNKLHYPQKYMTYVGNCKVSPTPYRYGCTFELDWHNEYMEDWLLESYFAWHEREYDCSETMQETTLTEIKDYRKMFDFYDWVEPFLLVPDNVMELDVKEFYANYKSYFPEGTDFEILLRIQYDDPTFALEQSRLANLAAEDSVNYRYPAYVMLSGSQGCYEYVLMNENEKSMTYVFIRGKSISDMKFIAKTLLPLNFCEHLQKDI